MSDGGLLVVVSVSDSQAGWLTWKPGVPSEEDTCALRGDDMRGDGGDVDVDTLGMYGLKRI